jgi:hypothetical protein
MILGRGAACEVSLDPGQLARELGVADQRPAGTGQRLL